MYREINENPGIAQGEIGYVEQQQQAPVVGATPEPAIAPAPAASKPNYLMYIGIAIAVAVVGYLIYKYAIKKD